MPLRFAIAALASLIAVATTSPALSADDRKVGSTQIRIVCCDTSAQTHKTIILNDPDAPLQIRDARTFSLSPSQKAGLKKQIATEYWRYIPDGPLVEISVSRAPVTAAKFGIVFYDSFNEPAGGLTGVTTSIDVPGTWMRWQGRTNLSFPEFGIACVFVSAARMRDGSVWKADLNKVSVMMAAEGCSTEGEEGSMRHLKRITKGATRL